MDRIRSSAESLRMVEAEPQPAGMKPERVALHAVAATATATARSPYSPPSYSSLGSGGAAAGPAVTQGRDGRGVHAVNAGTILTRTLFFVR